MAGYTPGLADLGALMRTRTRTDLGGELGTFTPDTRPTDVDAMRIILQAQSDVTDQTGVDIPQPAWGAAMSLITYRAAMLVELSYFAEQVAASKSPYPQYQALYADALPHVLTAVKEIAQGEQIGIEDDPGLPVWGFGTPVLPSPGDFDEWGYPLSSPLDGLGRMVGFRTRW